MARVKQKIYSGSAERTMESMVEVCQTTLQEMGMDVTTQYLDKTLIECVGRPPPGSPLGKQNIITVYKEGDKIYIKLKYEMPDPDQFFEIFETNLQIHGASTKEIEEKARVITKICKAIKEMGGEIDEEDAWDFLYHYEKRFKTLPDDDEINSIAMDYIKLMEEQKPVTEDADVFEEEDEGNVEEEEQFTISPTEALIAMVREIPTLDEETKQLYISLFDKLLLPDQERLVQKIKAIENDLNKIPYLLDDERKKIRREIYKLSREKRRQKLAQIIKERKKHEAYYMTRYVDHQIRNNLRKLPFLSERDVDDIMNVILTMPFDEKKHIVKKVSKIEKEIQEQIHNGLNLTDLEIRNLRLELIRMNEKEREERYEQLLRKQRSDYVKRILFKEIPQLEFEDHSKIVKELMWLSDDELKRRIEQLKAEKTKVVKERAKIFEKSAVGTACPKCGWPMGKFSKKCPRCGWSADWFDLDFDDEEKDEWDDLF